MLRHPQRVGFTGRSPCFFPDNTNSIHVYRTAPPQVGIPLGQMGFLKGEAAYYFGSQGGELTREYSSKSRN